MPTVPLTEVFRQAADSRIITNAHRIRRGQMPDTRQIDSNSDFHFVERDEPEKIIATLIKLVRERIPERFGLDPIRENRLQRLPLAGGENLEGPLLAPRDRLLEIDWGI